MLLRILEQTLLRIFAPLPRFHSHESQLRRGCFLLLAFLLVPTVAVADEEMFNGPDELTRFLGIGVSVKKMWEIEAQVLFRCPAGETIDSLSYDLPAWITDGFSKEISLSGAPVGQKLFTLTIPEANDGLCALASKGKLEPPGFWVEGKCRKPNIEGSSAWYASVEVGALVQCDGDIPEDVHEPTIRVETGGPPDQPPPDRITFFAASLPQSSASEGLGFGLRYSGSISSRFGIEGGLSRSRLEAEAPGADSTDLWTLDLHGTYRQPLNDRLQWVALGGIGWQFTSGGQFTSGEGSSGEESRSIASLSEGPSLAPSLGLGLELQLSSRVSIESRVLGRYRTNSFENDWSVEGQVGLVSHLGRRKERGVFLRQTEK